MSKKDFDKPVKTGAEAVSYSIQHFAFHQIPEFEEREGGVEPTGNMLPRLAVAVALYDAAGNHITSDGIYLEADDPVFEQIDYMALTDAIENAVKSKLEAG